MSHPDRNGFIILHGLIPEDIVALNTDYAHLEFQERDSAGLNTDAVATTKQSALHFDWLRIEPVLQPISSHSATIFFNRAVPGVGWAKVTGSSASHPGKSRRPLGGTSRSSCSQRVIPMDPCRGC